MIIEIIKLLLSRVMAEIVKLLPLPIMIKYAYKLSQRIKVIEV